MVDITLRQIRYFLALAKSRQYLLAARHLGISQPSLSIQINALETALNARLVERRRSGLILTPVGREVVVQAEKILREIERLKHLAGQSKDDLSGTLRLGSSPTIGPYLLPHVLRQLHFAYPELKLVIRDGPPRALVEDLVAGQHDIILSQLPLPEEDIRVRALFDEPLVLAVARDHRLAHRKHVQRVELAGESLLSLNSTYALHRMMTVLAQNTGAVFREDLEGTSLDALRQMVSLGMGVTLLPALYTNSEVGDTKSDVVILPIRPKLRRSIGLAWRVTSGRPPAFDRFAEMIEKVVSEEFSKQVKLVREN